MSKPHLNWDQERGHTDLTQAEKDAIAAYRQFVKMRRAFENIYMLARREKRKAKSDISADAWGHVIRFCEEGGAKPSVLRADAVSGPSPASCTSCGKSEPNWQHNRCPNCGELAE